MISIVAPVLAAVIALGVFVIWQSRRKSDQMFENDAFSQKKTVASDPYEDIEPLQKFDWSTTEPIQIRPFKPKYHLTMAIENCPLSDLIAIDKTYAERLKLRKSVMDNNYPETVKCNPACEPAVMELYGWIFGTYLPKRFPTMYRLVDCSEKSDIGRLHNLVTDEFISLKAPSALEALYTLGHNVDDEFLILLPSSKAEDGTPVYHLMAYVTCFPSGFSTPDKFEQPLAGIHKPVPGYKAKLEKSMDRFFAKLETGRAVKRANWSVTTDDKLFVLSGNHLYANGSSKPDDPDGTSEPKNEKTLDVDAPGLQDIIEKQKKEVVIENCRLRCERQTLHRLRDTKAIVFAFKTYQYKLKDVKADGDGPALADAIDGLSQGSVPDMAFYKRGVVWGEKVCEYLRS